MMRPALMHRGRDALMKAAGAIGLGHLLLASRSNRLTIPVYHHIGSPDSTFAPTVSPSRFEAHVRYLSRLRTARLDEAVRNSTPGTGHTLAVTFDDGWHDFALHAAPVLEKYNVAATVFIAAGLADTTALTWAERLEEILCAGEADTIDFAGGGEARSYPLRTRDERVRAWYAIGEWLVRQPVESRQVWLNSRAPSKADRPGTGNGSHRIMSWSEIRSLPESLVELGSHGMSHEPMETLPRDAATAEFVDSRRAIEQQAGREVSGFSYPNDSAEAWMSAAAADAGYGYACRVEGRTNALPLADRYAITRVHIRNWTAGQLSAELSPLGDAIRRLRQRRVARS